MNTSGLELDVGHQLFRWRVGSIPIFLRDFPDVQGEHHRMGEHQNQHMKKIGELQTG